MTASTTSSSKRNLIPLTPIAVLPDDLSSFSLKRIAKPFLVAINTSSLGLHNLTRTSLSSSRIVMHLIPVCLILENALKFVFFVIPLAETKTKLFLTPVKLSILVISIIFSPGLRLT